VDLGIVRFEAGSGRNSVATGACCAQSIVDLSPDNQALWQDLAKDGYILQKNIPALAQPAP